MRAILRHRPSPAMVVACIALTIALGGTSYAASRLPANSVGTKQLKKNAVTSPKVKNNSLTGADVLESSFAKVPSAANADRATNATNATNAANATNATNAANATNATHAANADHATIADSVSPLAWTTLTMKNSWVGDCFGGGIPQIAKSSEGIVYFRGEMCRTSGSSSNPFDMPPGFIPSKELYLTTDQASATTGRLFIDTTGEVTAEDDFDHPGSAAMFTSLAGVSYALV